MERILEWGDKNLNQTKANPRVGKAQTACQENSYKQKFFSVQWPVRRWLCAYPRMSLTTSHRKKSILT